MKHSSTVLPSLFLGFAAACTEAPTEPPPIDPPTPSPLARCADPAVAFAEAWRVDNLHDPITRLTRLDDTIVVASADGALKTWLVAPGAATEARPTYGTPIVGRGTAIGALAAADGAVASLDADGQARLWGADGAELGTARALVAEPGTFVAIDRDARWLVGGTAAFAGGLTIADLSTGQTHGPVPTQLWEAAAARIVDAGWLTAGHWYSCLALDLRDPAAPDVERAYWDACHGPGGTSQQGWFRDLAVDTLGTTVVAAGDQAIATFTLPDLGAGPRAIAAHASRLDRVVLLDADQVAITLSTEGETSTLTWWSLPSLTPVRTATVPAAVDLVIDPASGLAVTAHADGLLRGHACE